MLGVGVQETLRMLATSSIPPSEYTMVHYNIPVEGCLEAAAKSKASICFWSFTSHRWKRGKVTEDVRLSNTGALWWWMGQQGLFQRREGTRLVYTITPLNQRMCYYWAAANHWCLSFTSLCAWNFSFHNNPQNLGDIPPMKTAKGRATEVSTQAGSLGMSYPKMKDSPSKTAGSPTPMLVPSPPSLPQNV